MVGGQNTMYSGIKIPWVEGVKIQWVGGQNTKSGGQNTMGRGLIYHRYRRRYTMGREVKIQWVSGLLYHG